MLIFYRKAKMQRHFPDVFCSVPLFLFVLAITLKSAVPSERPQVQSKDQRPTVKKWDFFEQSFAQPDIEGFDGVDLQVTYKKPDGTVLDFYGFYRGDHQWSFRCMPDQAGIWHYETRFSEGTAGPFGSFVCVQSDLPGMISRDESNPMWFGFKGGRHRLIRALHIGDRFFADKNNSVTGAPWSAQQRTQFLDWAQQQGYNLLSIASHLLQRREEGRGQGWDSPDLWDEKAGAPNPKEYDRMERILDELSDRGMMVYPFAGFMGRSSDFPRDSLQQELYLQYTLARLAPYWNVMFMVGGPEPMLKGKPYLTREEIHRLASRIAELDPFDHLLSVHNPTGNDLFRDAGWLNYGILQGPKTLDRVKLGSGLLANHHPEKPLLAQETLWSGNIYHMRQTGGGYSDDDLRKNAYVINMSATALVFADNDGNSSSGFSGSLALSDCRQERHDIIKRVWDVFESFPFYHMSPRPDLITHTQDANIFCLAEPGRCYLFYFDAPGRLEAIIEGGPFNGEWINGRNATDRVKIDPVDQINGIMPPDRGDDWLLWLTSAL